MKKAYVFPGQGAQFPGMAKELYQQNSLAKELFEQANEILGFRITDLMFDGTVEDLKATKVTQPAIFLHSVILAKCYASLSAEELNKLNLPPFEPMMLAGHSLGEFSALAVSEAISFEDALKLVSIRANEMQKCCEKVPGTMAAIIGLDNDTIEQICLDVPGIVVPANYNCDGQVVISGEKSAIECACERAKEAGAKRALPLTVGGAFHSPLMEPASIELGKAIESTPIKTPIVPIYQNYTALPETEPSKIKDNLLKQLTSPVKWTQTIKQMVEDGTTYYMEIGPGNVLQGLIKRIAGNNVEVTGIVNL